SATSLATPSWSTGSLSTCCKRGPVQRTGTCWIAPLFQIISLPTAVVPFSFTAVTVASPSSLTVGSSVYVPLSYVNDTRLVGLRSIPWPTARPAEVTAVVVSLSRRSEERRVGKEVETRGKSG